MMWRKRWGCLGSRACAKLKSDDFQHTVFALDSSSYSASSASSSNAQCRTCFLIIVRQPEVLYLSCCCYCCCFCASFVCWLQISNELEKSQLEVAGESPRHTRTHTCHKKDHSNVVSTHQNWVYCHKYKHTQLENL